MRERIMKISQGLPIIVAILLFGCTEVIETEPKVRTSSVETIGHTEWIANILKEAQSIRKGMTRGDLLKVFITEGGISHPTQRTYVHRNCPYIKVDVEFKTTNEDPRSLKENPEDVITEISKLYLQWSIMD